MSIWEKSDLVIDGRTVVAGTSEWDQIIQARTDTAFARLTCGGPAIVDGMQAGPGGRHHSPQAATWAARWILSRIA